MLEVAEASCDALNRVLTLEFSVTPLRQRMIEDLKIRNRSLRTIGTYVQHVAQFARHFGRSPELLGPEEVRQYQLHLLEKKISFSTFNQCLCSLRFLYGTTLGRPEMLPRLPYGRLPKTIPQVLSQAQALKLLECVRRRRHRVLLTTIYATGLRMSEAVHLGVADIDSADDHPGRAGKGNKQRLGAALAGPAPGTAGVVARAPQPAVAVPRQSAGSPAQHVVSADSLPAGRGPGGAPSPRVGPHVASHLCHGTVGSGRRPVDDPEDPGTCRSKDDADLHPCASRPAARSVSAPGNVAAPATLPPGGPSRTGPSREAGLEIGDVIRRFGAAFLDRYADT